MNETELLLLKTAILFHDLVYLKQYDDNEFIGGTMAADTLPKFNYTYEQIDTIKNIILSTRIPQIYVILLLIGFVVWKPLVLIILIVAWLIMIISWLFLIWQIIKQ